MEGGKRITRSKTRGLATVQKAENLSGAASSSTSGPQASAQSNSKARDQDNRTELGSLTDFDITPLATVLKHCRILRDASIPSPLWSGALDWQPTGSLLFNKAQDLYQEIRNQRTTLQEEVRTQAEFHEQGRRKGLLCWWEYLNTTSSENLYDDTDDESGGESIKKTSRDLNYAWVDATMELDINVLKAELNGKYKAPTARKVLDICRLRCISGVGDTQPGEFRHFILNFDQAFLSINGIPIDMGRVAGPLPEFAVIEINGSLLFWWGTVAAIDFVPADQPANGDRKRLLADGQEYENLGGSGRRGKKQKISTTNPNSGDSNLGSTLAGQNYNAGSAGRKGTGVTHGGEQVVETPTGLPGWREEYHRLFKRCAKSTSEAIDLESYSQDPHRLDKYTNLEIDDIVLAIAAVRLSKGNGDLHQCFGDSNLYAYARHQRELDIACVGASNWLLMPLFFDESSKFLKGEILSNIQRPPRKTFIDFQHSGKPSPKPNPFVNGGLRHSMFAFARYREDSRAVSIDFIDSKKDGEAQDLIRETARNLVRNSGWLRNDWPKFESERWLRSPSQVGDTSGVHTILNAWSLMIKLPVNAKSYRMNSEFYAEALKVINLGLQGKLDSWTIRAFLQFYGYARPQELAAAKLEGLKDGDIPRGLRNRQTVLMNKDILDRALHHMRKPDYEEDESFWEQRLRDGILRMTKRARERNSFKNRIKSSRALYDEQVHMIIASLWEGLRQANLSFAFGTIATFRGNRAQDMQIADTEAVLGPAPLIIPLFFGDEMPSRVSGQNAGPPIGHHLLVVVKRDQSDDQLVHASIYDSEPGARPYEEIQTAVENLVRFTGWMGIDTNGRPLPVTPTISYQHIATPLQEGSNSCGFYQILNAWAVMLGIGIHPHRHRRIDSDYRKFHKDGIVIFNLALAGCMDSATIHAFLNVYGYSVEPNPEKPVRQIETVALNSQQFDNLMGQLRRQGQQAAQGAAELMAYGTRTPAPLQWSVFPGREEVERGRVPYTIQAFDQVMSYQVHADIAHEALMMYGGDVEAAIAQILMPEGPF